MKISKILSFPTLALILLEAYAHHEEASHSSLAHLVSHALPALMIALLAVATLVLTVRWMRRPNKSVRKPRDDRV